jgi:hypothetical protein
VNGLLAAISAERHLLDRGDGVLGGVTCRNDLQKLAEVRVHDAAQRHVATVRQCVEQRVDRQRSHPAVTVVDIGLEEVGR